MGECSPYLRTALAMFRAPRFFILQGTVGKIHPAAHKGVGQIRPLQDGGGTEGLVHFNDRFGLGHGIDVERPLGVTILFSCLHQRPKGYERHISFPPVFLSRRKPVRRLCRFP